MSTIFANNIKNISGGGNVKINQLSGIDTAGSILVTAEGNNTTTNLQQGLNKVWFTLGMDAAMDDSFNCSSSVDDDGAGDFGIHFTNPFNNALYSSGVAVTVDGLNPRGMVQSPSKAAGSVEVRMMSMDNGVDTESNITHTEMQICGDLA